MKTEYLWVVRQSERLRIEYLWAARKTEDWIFVSSQRDWRLNVCEQSDSQRDWRFNICERPQRLKSDYLWAARSGRPVWCLPSATGLAYCWSLNIIRNEDWTFVSSQIFVRSQSVRETENWIFVSGQNDWNLNICEQGWAKLVLIALERYSVALKRLTFNLR